ncbi:FtsX-like permease family protein [Stackebrandtia albiflava]|uniref:FtsX-like permease family protein n=1 Tax=Stackebrandtia albiflava TaxID=406432 RepID=A0A562V9P9_9ACTN|nr:ABC transporter permease [Stackebrandtia albiflava]TWJ14609.1 FtsX-like permease family protein [Stackebrandtia albiflava]
MILDSGYRWHGGGTTLFGVILRGIRFRPARSLVVFLLAVATTAAAVLTPAYTDAAGRSLLVDELTSQDGRALQLQVVDVRDLDAGPDDPAASIEAVAAKVAGAPALDVYTDPVGFLRSGGLVTGGRYDARALLAYRENACAHLSMIDGDCVAGPGEVLISERSAGEQQVGVGDTVALSGLQAAESEPVPHTVAGVYRPHDPEDPYWGRSGYFGHGTDSGGDRHLDALLVTDPAALLALPRGVRVGADYRLDVAALRSADVTAVREALEGLETPPDDPAGIALAVDTNLPGVFDVVADGRAAVARTVPPVAVPLLVLCWLVLYLVTTRLMHERGAEIGLAKLRGLRRRSVVAFAMGEALLLIAAGSPVGMGLGLLVVEVTGRLVLAEGVGVAVTPGAWWFAGVALAGSGVALTAAAYRTVRRPVLRLLRRVSVRRRVPAGIWEAVVVALAVAATAQLLTGETGGMSMLAPALLATVAGVVAARLLGGVSRLRHRVAARRGSVAAMLATWQLARRGEFRRMVALLTVAITLLTFGFAAWDMSAHNRRLAASDQVGADLVYQVDVADPDRLMEVVSTLDPDGGGLMGVMRTTERYGSRNFTVIAAQTDRMAEVMRWRGHDATTLAELSGRLHPAAPDPVSVRGSIEVTASVTVAEAERPLQLTARILEPGRSPRNVLMGDLRTGRHDYRVSLSGCDDGCRLVGIGVARYPGDFEDVSFAVAVERVADADGEAEGLLTTVDGWRSSGLTPRNVPFEVAADGVGLTMSATGVDVPDLIAEYVTAPSPLPAVLAGDAPDDDPSAARFWFPAPHGAPQHYATVATASVIPRGGDRALLVDLEYTDRIADAFTSLGGQTDIGYEVWATAEAGAGLPARLAAEGVTVTRTLDRADLLDRMSRQPSALALRLYLLAGGAALALAVGAVALTAAAGSRPRGYDDAALRVAGVPPGTLRRAARIEHVHWAGLSIVMGTATGLAATWLVVPSIRLVDGVASGALVEYHVRAWWVAAAVAVAAAALTGTAAAVDRWRARHGTVQRLREGER